MEEGKETLAAAAAAAAVGFESQPQLRRPQPEAAARALEGHVGTAQAFVARVEEGAHVGALAVLVRVAVGVLTRTHRRRLVIYAIS